MASKIQGTQGWKAFLAEKHDLVRMYTSATEKAHGRPIKTEPGNVAEGAFRTWLEGFLPGRFGVTSGYIISSGDLDNVPLKHFDVIIYDKFNSPQLWSDGNPDRSIQGKHRPIPVEHIVCIIEVKATLTKASAEESIAKINELVPYVGVESPGTYYPKYLPPGFVSGVVFFRASSTEDAAILDSLNDPNLPGFFGGIVLSETENPYCEESGLLGRSVSEDRIEPIKESILNGFAFSKSVEVGDRHHCVTLQWGANSFVFFAYRLLGMMTGTSRPGFVDTFHGIKFSGTFDAAAFG